jgi:hypothetical protein
MSGVKQPNCSQRTSSSGGQRSTSPAAAPRSRSCASGSGSTPLSHGETGLLAEPTEEALASSLLAVLRTPALRERLRKTALATVRERTWDASLGQLASGYRSALLRAAAPGRAQAA